jgi:hypothetical protein
MESHHKIIKNNNLTANNYTLNQSNSNSDIKKIFRENIDKNLMIEFP